MTDLYQEFSAISLDRWQGFIEQHPGSTVFHHRHWIELLHSYYRLPIKIFAVCDGQTVRAAAPFLQTRTLRGRTKLTSLPFSDHVPILYEDTASLSTLVEGIRREPLANHRSVAVRGDVPGFDLPQADIWVRRSIELPSSMEQLRSKFRPPVRRNLKKARRHGLQFTRETNLEAMEDFYRLHVNTRRKLGVPVQRWSFFSALHATLIERQLGFIGVIRRNKSVFAAAVFLAYNKTLIYKYGASDPRLVSYRPNDLLIENGLRVGVEQSFDALDFGIARRQQVGLGRFKAKWGGAEHPVPHTYFHGIPDADREQSLPRRVAARLIRSSPTVVCRALGSALYPYSQ